MITITKETSPYLYLTDDSGVYINDGSVRIPVNPNAHEGFVLVGLQIWLMQKSGTKIADIDNGSVAFSFELEGNGLYTQEYLTMQQNGVECDVARFYPGEWSALNFTFDGIDFDGVAGHIRLYPGFVYNNISLTYHESSAPTGKNTDFDNLVGNSVIVVQDRATLAAFDNGVDTFVDIEWATVQRSV